MFKDYPNNSASQERESSPELIALTHLGEELIKENRRNRRFKIFNRLLFVALLGAIFVLPSLLHNKTLSAPVSEHAAIVKMEGLVMPGADIDAELINPALRKAFEAKASKGVILQINSPGGSPVQAERIYDEIMRLKEEYPDKKVVAVIEDVGASAAYYIAASADHILSAKASLVGSIGVIINGFGADQAIAKLGIERRLITAGSNKAMLDPFLPEVASEREYMQLVVDEVHQQFIDAVKRGRGDRLIDDETLFSGLIWNGAKAVELGLVDQIGTVDTALQDLIEVDKAHDYTPASSLLDELSGQLGVSLSAALSRLALSNRYSYQ